MIELKKFNKSGGVEWPGSDFWMVGGEEFHLDGEYKGHFWKILMFLRKERMDRMLIVIEDICL